MMRIKLVTSDTQPWKRARTAAWWTEGDGCGAPNADVRRESSSWPERGRPQKKQPRLCKIPRTHRATDSRQVTGQRRCGVGGQGRPGPTSLGRHARLPRPGRCCPERRVPRTLTLELRHHFLIALILGGPVSAIGRAWWPPGGRSGDPAVTAQVKELKITTDIRGFSKLGHT